MTPGDLCYSNVDPRPLSVAVSGQGDRWWNFVAGAYESPATLDPTKHLMPLTASKVVPMLQTGVIPGKACMDIAAVLVEFITAGAVPTQSYLVTITGYSITSARGATQRFNG